jgi:hypothetical protein
MQKKLRTPALSILSQKDLCRVHAELLEVDADEGEERSECREEEEVEQLRYEKAVRRRVRKKPGENIGNGAGFRFRVFVLKSIFQINSFNFKKPVSVSFL